jgi:hypothetical protein
MDAGLVCMTDATTNKKARIEWQSSVQRKQT